MSNRTKFLPEDVAYIYNWLRKATITWSGRKEALQLARKKTLVKRTKAGKPVYKYLWQCKICLQWFREESSMEVDHVVEIGGVTSFNGDWNEMIAKVFPRPVSEHMQVVCIVCHQRKTAAWAAANKKWQRKR